SFSLAPRPSERAVAAFVASAWRISSTRCEGVSLTATWAGFTLSGCGFAGAALAAPDWTAAAIRAATPARARVARGGVRVGRCAVWEVRLREELLLNTDSFCVTAGRAARGDRTVGWDVRAEQGVTRNHVQAAHRQRMGLWGCCESAWEE